MSGYDCDFVDVPPKELNFQCSICLLVLRQPYLVDCCGYNFCKVCLEGLYNGNTVQCPLCRKEDFKAIQNKGLERELNQRMVYCPNKKCGCNWIGELRQFDSHVNGSMVLSRDGKPADGTRSSVLCQFVQEHCPYCPVTMLRSQIEEHIQDECPNKPVTCKYCNSHTASPKDMENHHLECPIFPLSCPNECGAKILRKDICSHSRSECPLAKIECKYCHAGCMVVLPRNEMKKHLDSVSEMPKHLMLMNGAYSSLKSKIDEQNDIITDLEDECAMLKERLTCQEAQLSKLRSENRSLREARQDSGESAVLGAVLGGLAGLGLGAGAAALVQYASRSDAEEKREDFRSRKWYKEDNKRMND